MCSFFFNVISYMLFSYIIWILLFFVFFFYLYLFSFFFFFFSFYFFFFFYHFHKMFCYYYVGHFVLFCSLLLQQPVTKINHAVVIIGGFGIGKDIVLEFLKYAVCLCNFIYVYG